MAGESVVTDEMRAVIGKKGRPLTFEVEQGAVRKFAAAIGDPNPLWSDEALARRTRYGGIIAPPTFLCTMNSPTPSMPEIPYSRGLNGGNEWEYFQPIRVGDRITVVSQIADIYERGGRLGNMVFVVRETIYTNQFGEKVAVSRNTGIRY